MTSSFDAAEIHNWSDLAEAPSTLPQLVRLLVMDTLAEPPKEIRMPSGSSVNRGGWDGLLNVDSGNAWVPGGVSGWEFSCRASTGSKANADYKKRSADPLGLGMSNTTFVFLTSRRWQDKLQWEQERREEGVWADVWVLDADDLVGWLEQSPEVTKWFARIIQRRAFDYESLAALNVIEANTEKTLSLMSELKAQVDTSTAPTVASEEPATLTTSENPAYPGLVAQIDLARDLLKQGLIATARSKFEEIQIETDDIPDDLKFRIVTNLAACALGDNRIEDACSLFEQAYGMQPEKPAAMANAAVAAELQQDYERALELVQMARAADPQDSNATATFIRVLWRMGQVEQIEKLLASEKWITQDQKTAYALAGVRLEQERFGEAISAYRSLVVGDPEDAEAHLAFAQSLINYASTVGRYGDEWLEQVREAKSEAERAAQLLQGTDLRSRYLEACVVYAVACAQLGDSDEALSEIEAVLREDPTHANAAFNKGILLLKEGRPEEARSALEIIQDPEGLPDVVLPLAEACLESGDPNAAIGLLRSNLKLDPPSWEEARRADVLLRAEAETGDEDSVGPILAASLKKYPDDSSLLRLDAMRSQILRDLGRAETMYVRAIESASIPEREMILTELGSFYENQERFSEAADLFGEVVRDNVFHPAAVPLLVCLYNSGRRREALVLARRIRGTLTEVPQVVIELEVQILQYIGDVRAMAMRLEEVASRSASSPFDQVRLAMAKFRCGDRDATLALLQGIDVSELTSDPQALMKLAYLKRFLGELNYVEDAYQARSYGINDPVVHLEFFRLFQGMQKDWVEPEVVEPGCVVRLMREGEEQWWRVPEDGEEIEGRRVLSPDSSLTQQLLGRRPGETIVSPRYLQDVSYEITAIQSKYARAYQETLDEFSTRFPDNMALSSVSVGDDFAPVFQVIESRSQLVRNAEELYRSAKVPFATFCAMVNRHVLDVWPEYIMQPSTRILFGFGNDLEARVGGAVLTDADSVVLDMIALLTVHKLGIMSRLRERFMSVVIPQSVFDEIQGVVYSMRMDAAPMGSMGKDEVGNYTGVDIPESVWAERLEYVTSVLELANSIDRVPSYPMLDSDDPERLVEALTYAGAGAIFAGYEESSTSPVLVSDDVFQSVVARSVGVGAVNTQALLSEMLRSDVITDEVYSSWVEQLALMNYWLVRVRAQDIVRTLDPNTYQTTEGTRAMLKTLRGPDCSEDYAAAVGAEVVAYVTTGPLLREHADYIVRLVLAELQSGRRTNVVSLKFKGEIVTRLALAPLQCARILQAVDLYMLT